MSYDDDDDDEQRAPPIFGRATITLGIGPHSSFLSAVFLTVYTLAILLKSRKVF